MLQLAVRAWLTGGMIRQSCWDKILLFTGDDLASLYTYGTIHIINHKKTNKFFPQGVLTVMFCTYWTVGGLYTAMDVLNRPVAFRKYKVQPGTNEPVDRKKLIQVFIIQQ